MKLRNVLIVLMLSLAFAFSPGCDSSKRAAGDRVIVKVKQFQQRQGRLPSSLEEIGEGSDERGAVYYEKRSETHFIVWYGTSLGESMTYDSSVGRWEEHN